MVPRKVVEVLLMVVGISLCMSISLVEAEAKVVHHKLRVQINPDSHELAAEDTLVLHPDQFTGSKSLKVLLNKHFSIDHVLLQGKRIPYRRIEPSGQDGNREGNIQVIELSWTDSAQTSLYPLSLTVSYHGLINEPPQAGKGLRFVRLDKTNGHIGPEGVYLTSETAWYPYLLGTLSTFDVQATVPNAWEVVTQGKEVSRSTQNKNRTSTWQVSTTSEALTLVANQFVKNQREWQGIEIATYLFPSEAHLSELYLNATITYLKFYTKLLGPYPFPKFAVVENFFPSGIGLPSYTLLGNRVIKRGYTQPYSLGHEIVHSWYGNSVLNDFSTGNWVEGLTTYMANYYFEELHSPPEKALSLRKRMFYEYSLYATPPLDYPLVRFHHKETRLDNAIGYQKAAIIFHMLRLEIGDQAFFSGARRLVEDRTVMYTGWEDLEKVFGEVSNRDLHWFFHQWVQQQGAPSLKIVDWNIEPSPHSSEEFQLTVRLKQVASSYGLKIPVVVELATGETHRTIFVLESSEHIFKIVVPARPVSLTLDPYFESLRRLGRHHIPPMLNVWATDQFQVVVASRKAPQEEREAYQPTLRRIHSRDSGIVQQTDEYAAERQASTLILGNPKHDQMVGEGLAGCGEKVQVDQDRFTIQGQTFEGSGMALLVSCPHMLYPGGVVSLFFGLSPSAVKHVARLLFFYGWDSYLVFRDGKVLVRGMFNPPGSPLKIQLDAA